MLQLEREKGLYCVIHATDHFLFAKDQAGRDFYLFGGPANFLHVADRDRQSSSCGGLADLDGIAKTDGIDGVFIGPADLSASMGRRGQATAPDVRAKIEKAIQKSDLGLTPANDGKLIRLTMPPLNEERRKQLAKAVGKQAEEARVAVRNIRREAKEKLRALGKDKTISEDDEKRSEAELQKLTDRFVQRVDELLKKKEQEILEF